MIEGLGSEEKARAQAGLASSRSRIACRQCDGVRIALGKIDEFGHHSVEMPFHCAKRGVRVAFSQRPDDRLVLREGRKLPLWRAHEQACPVEAAARRFDRMLDPV